MKKETSVLFITMILNLSITLLKFFGGLAFGFTTLTADALHSLSDFITDIVSSLASKIGRKRANKKYPFGYGLIENLANLFIGIVLFALGIFIIIEAFSTHETNMSSEIFVVLIIVICLKMIVILLLKIYGKKLKSSTLLISAKESFADLISSIIVLIVSILLLFKDVVPVFQYADKVGSLIISIIVFKISFQIMGDNIKYLLGANVEDESLTLKIQEVIKIFSKIKSSKITLLKMGTYYNLYVIIELDQTITLKQLFNLENKLRKKIKNARLNIKFIEIEPRIYK